MVFVLTLPLWLSNSKLLIATATGIIAIIAVSLVLLTGWAGPREPRADGVRGHRRRGRCLGHPERRAGTSASRCSPAARRAQSSRSLVGIPAARAGGLTLAVTTLALAPAVLYWLLNPEFFDWVPRGRFDRDRTLFGTITIESQMSFYFLTLAVLALAIAMAYGIRRSRTGRVLIALRENPRAAEAYGINALRTMLAGFAISGFLAAIAGVLFVHHQHMISQDIANNPFSADASLRVFAIVVIGGMASVPGAILGADLRVRACSTTCCPSGAFLATGVGLLAILLILPGGLGAGLAEARDGGAARGSRGAAASSCRACSPTGVTTALELTPSMAAAVAEAVDAARDRGSRGDGHVNDRLEPDPPTAAPGAVQDRSASPCTSRARPQRLLRRDQRRATRSTRCSSCSG